VALRSSTLTSPTTADLGKNLNNEAGHLVDMRIEIGFRSDARVAGQQEPQGVRPEVMTSGHANVISA
jgi:hypothetical protein